MSTGTRRIRTPRAETGKGVRRLLALCSSVGVLGSMIAFAAVGTAGVAASAAPTITNYPRIGVPWHGQYNTWSASNWSGYAETGTFSGVSGTWTVPAVSATSSSTYSSAWIGVDGFNDDNLIQTGTEEDYYSGAAHYDAWWEILPAAETEISTRSYPVTPGDRMSASIYETSQTQTTGGGGGFLHRQTQTEHVWDIKIADTTKGWSFSTSQGYSGAGSSAEWVMEAPEVGSRIATLAHYTISPPAGTGDFDNAGILTGIVSSGTPTYTTAGLNYQSDSGVMIQNGAQVSTPGNPDTALSAFDAAYGSAVPPTPAG
jgi:Peptidase A4 family